ncbi:MAG: hypothetical protein HOH74_01075, partial [Gemmatimonadetes bacterium]|nr:hypothetical protein [Gemmatimonadota bacterium]
WWWVARDFVLQEYVLGGLMLAGVVRALFRRDRFDWVLMAVTLPAFAYIGSWTRESLHYLLPYIPILIVQVARLLQEVAQRARLPSAWMSVVVGCLLLMPNAVSSLAEGIQRHRPDTRSLAAAWIAANIPDGSGIGMTWLPYCPRLQPIAARQGLESAYRNQPDALRQLQSHWRGQPSYRLVNLEVWLKEPVVPEALRAHVDLEDAETRRIFSRGWRSLRQLHRAGVQYLVLPTAAYARYLRDDLHPASVAAGFRLQLNRAYFEMLLAPTNAEIVAVIEESPATRGGAITILRLHSPEETSPVSH